MNNDYSTMARAFGSRQGGPFAGQPRPQQAGPYGGIMAGQPQRPPQQMPQQPQQFGPMPGMAPRPNSGGGIMGGQPQAPRPMQMAVPQQHNPISLAPRGAMRRPF